MNAAIGPDGKRRADRLLSLSGSDGNGDDLAGPTLLFNANGLLDGDRALLTSLGGRVDFDAWAPDGRTFAAHHHTDASHHAGIVMELTSLK